MPILNINPWRLQFFKDIVCPEDVKIPIKDWDAWELNPRHQWVYDKLRVAQTQGILAAPHGVIPPTFPVFSKPITNLCNMGAGSMEIPDLKRYQAFMQPGHMWCTLLTGEHISTDAVVIDGIILWWRHTKGITARGGTFDYWHVLVEGKPEIEDWCGKWAQKYLKGYTGMVNFETIGNRVIELHLRFSDQWPDLYGSGWMEAMVNLYVTGVWEFDDYNRTEGFSVVLFGPHGPTYRYPDPEIAQKVRQIKGVTSIQFPFYEDRKMEEQSMPPGGFRMAIINSTSLKAGMIARDILKAAMIALKM